MNLNVYLYIYSLLAFSSVTTSYLDVLNLGLKPLLLQHSDIYSLALKLLYFP